MSDFSKLKGLNPTQKDMYWRQLITMDTNKNLEWIKQAGPRYVGSVTRPVTAPGTIRPVIEPRTSYQDDYPKRKILDAARPKSAGMSSFHGLPKAEITDNNRRFAAFHMLQELGRYGPPPARRGSNCSRAQGCA